MLSLSQTEVFQRLLLITFLSGLIGIDREYHHKPAGLRTNVMVGLGSTLMTIASFRVLEVFPHTSLDPTRIAAQIVTGIGFIGAGAILRPKGDNVIGLTTASTLWVVSGLGIAVGFGLYLEAIMTTAMVFFTFLVLSRLVKAVRRTAEKRAGKHTAEQDQELDELAGEK